MQQCQHEVAKAKVATMDPIAGREPMAVTIVLMVAGMTVLMVAGRTTDPTVAGRQITTIDHMAVGKMIIEVRIGPIQDAKVVVGEKDIQKKAMQPIFLPRGQKSRPAKANDRKAKAGKRVALPERMVMQEMNGSGTPKRNMKEARDAVARDMGTVKVKKITKKVVLTRATATVL